MQGLSSLLLTLLVASHQAFLVLSFPPCKRKLCTRLAPRWVQAPDVKESGADIRYLTWRGFLALPRQSWPEPPRREQEKGQKGDATPNTSTVGGLLRGAGASGAGPREDPHPYRLLSGCCSSGQSRLTEFCPGVCACPTREAGSVLLSAG